MNWKPGFIAFIIVGGLVMLGTVGIAYAQPLYTPGQTLDPSCLPTNPDCTVATSTASLTAANVFTNTNTFNGAVTANAGLTANALSLGSLSGLLFGTSGTVGTVATSTLNINTDNLVEGTNKFFTNARAVTALTGQNISIFNNDSLFLNAAGVNSYISASSTIAKLYAANSWSALQTFGNNISLGGAQLNMSALASGNLISYNGTNWVNVATSSLNLSIPLASTTGILGIGNGGTGATTFGQGWIYSPGGTNAFVSSTSPTVAYITATSTTATSTFANLTVTNTLTASTLNTSNISSYAAGSSDPDFTMVLIPDTQNEYNTLFSTTTANTSMASWIVANKGADNIKAVLSLGDITWGADYDYVKAHGFDLIANAGIAYIPIPGNHDYSNFDTRASTLYTASFGGTNLTGYSWFGGQYDSTGQDTYIKVESGTRKFLILGLELYPRQAILNWAQGIININPDREVIVVTHAYLQNSGTRLSNNTQADPPGEYFTNPNNYTFPEVMWQNFVRVNPQISIVANGHFISYPNMANLTSANVIGRKVYQQFINYQNYTNGGSGYLLLLKFKPSQNKLTVESFSPTLNQDDASNPPFDASYEQPQMLNLSNIVNVTDSLSVGKYLNIGGSFMASDTMQIMGLSTATSSISTHLQLPNQPCNGYLNGGKLTTDASGNVICADDTGSGGGGFSGGTLTAANIVSTSSVISTFAGGIQVPSLSGGVSNNTTLNDGLQLYIPFDNSTSTDAGPNNIMIHDAGYGSYVAGKINGARYLPGGAGGSVSVPFASSTSAISGLSEFTNSFWVNTSSAGGWGTTYVVTGKHVGSSNGEWFVAFTGSNTLRFAVINAAYSRVNFDVTLPTNLANGNWHLLTFTYSSSASTMAVYEDGAFVASTTQTGTMESVPSQPLTIGCQYPTGGADFTGDLDEYRLYNRALSPAEISQLYTQTGLLTSTTYPVMTFGSTGIGIGTTSPFAKLSVAGVSGGTTPLFAVSTSTASATTTVFQIDQNGLMTINTPGATSTINGNLYVNGALRSTTSYNGDLFFANNFSFTEAPLDGTPQGLLLKNQNGSTTLSIDENGNLTVTGDVCSNGAQCWGKSLNALSQDVSALASSTNLSILSATTQTGQSLSEISTSVASTSQSMALLYAQVTSLSSTTDSLQSTLSTSTLASTTAQSLITDQSFIQTLASAVQNLIQSAGKWVVQEIGATLAVFTDVKTTSIETQTAAVSNGLEMTSPDGQVWCVRIDDLGGFQRTPGTCSATSTTPVADQALNTNVQILNYNQALTADSLATSSESTTTTATSATTSIPINTTASTMVPTASVTSASSTVESSAATSTPPAIITIPSDSFASSTDSSSGSSTGQ